jgi:hypothetical protein
MPNTEFKRLGHFEFTSNRNRSQTMGNYHGDTESTEKYGKEQKKNRETRLFYLLSVSSVAPWCISFLPVNGYLESYTRIAWRVTALERDLQRKPC